MSQNSSELLPQGNAVEDRDVDLGTSMFLVL